MKKKIVALMIATITILSFGYTTIAAESDWSIVNGYGTVKNTGTGMQSEGNEIVLNGYGGICYMPEAVNEAVAVEFRVLAFPSTAHYFNFGLLDTKNVFWNTSGTLSKGIMSRVTISTDGNTMQASGYNITGAPVETIASIESPLNAMGVSHMFTIYRNGDSWIYSLDGESAKEIPVKDAKLGTNSYLSIGSYGSSTMEMVISNVFVDEAVTAEMKDGTYIKELAGDAGKNKVYYDEDDRLIIGETVKGGTLSYIEPSYLVDELETEVDMIMYVLGGSTIIFLAISIFVFINERKKQRKEVATGEKS